MSELTAQRFDQLPEYVGDVPAGSIFAVRIAGVTYRCVLEQVVPGEAIPDLDELTTFPAADDELEIIDKSDLTDGTDGTAKRILPPTLCLRFHKFDATAAPGVGDDSADGFSVGSYWFDVTNDKAYACLDASVGAAVWKEITLQTAIYEARHSAVYANASFYTSDTGSGRGIAVRIQRKMTITQVLWGCGIALTASDVSYWTFRVLKISNSGGAGAGTALCSAPATSQVTGGHAGLPFVQNQMYDMGVDQNLDVDVGDLVYMNITSTGTPPALTNVAHSITVIGEERP